MMLRRLRAALAALVSIALADVQPAAALSLAPPLSAVYVILPDATATAAKVTMVLPTPGAPPIPVGVLNSMTSTFTPSGLTTEQARAVAAEAKALQTTNAFSKIASAGTQAIARANLGLGGAALLNFGTVFSTVASAAVDPIARGAVQQVATIALLRAMPYAAAAVPSTVFLSGYYAAGDSGGGTFQWSASSTASDDGGMVIKPTGNTGAGRWLRVVTDRVVSPDFWGAKGDYAADDTTPVQAGVNYAVASGFVLEFRKPRYLITTANVSGTLFARGKGAGNTSIYRITSSDAVNAAASGGSLPAGTYRSAVYAYNGSTLLKVQPGAGTVTLDGSTTTALTVSYAAVSGATDYQVYVTSGASLFGATTSMQDAGTALSATVTALGTAVSGGAPRYVDPLFNIASGANTVNFDDIQINGNGRATQDLYYAGYTGGSYPYYYSGIDNRVQLYGGTINQAYYGNRRFASQCNHCDVSGGYDAVYMLNGADHRWFGTDISGAADANLVASGQTNITFTGGNFFFAPVGVRLVNTSNAQFVGGSMDGNTLHAWEIDSASSANAAIGTTFSNPAAVYDIFNQGLKTTLVGPSFRANASGTPQYNLYNDTTVDTVVVTTPTLFTSGTHSPPYSVAFTNTPTKLSEGMIGSRTLASSFGYFNQQVANGLTAAGTTQATAYALTAPVNRVTVGSGGVRLDLPVVGATVEVYNELSGALNLYPPAGAQIYSLAVNAAYAIPANSLARVTWLSSTYAEITVAPISEPTNTVTGGNARNLYGTGNATYQGGGAVGGANSVSNGFGAVALGVNTVADNSYSWARGGYSSARGRYGVDCYANGQFAAKGDRQVCAQVLSGSTTSAAALRLTADGTVAGAANTVNLPSGAVGSYSLRITLTAIDVTNPANTYSWSMPIALLSKTGAAQSTTVLTLGTPVTLATNSWAPTVTATADMTNGGLNLSFTPPSGNTDTLHVAARVESVEAQ